jgi:hypothetical protein
MIIIKPDKDLLDSKETEIEFDRLLEVPSCERTSCLGLASQTRLQLELELASSKSAPPYQVMEVSEPTDNQHQKDKFHSLLLLLVFFPRIRINLASFIFFCSFSVLLAFLISFFYLLCLFNPSPYILFYSISISFVPLISSSPFFLSLSHLFSFIVHSHPFFRAFLSLLSFHDISSLCSFISFPSLLSFPLCVSYTGHLPPCDVSNTSTCRTGSALQCSTFAEVDQNCIRRRTRC